MEFNCPAAETIFHCYKCGEWVDTYGIWDMDLDCELVGAEIIDLSEYDEVRIITISPTGFYWDSIEDCDDDCKFKCKEVTYKLPDGSELKCIELIDEILAEPDEIDGCGEIEVTSYTKNGSTGIPVGDRTEDDDDLGW